MSPVQNALMDLDMRAANAIRAHPFSLHTPNKTKIFKIELFFSNYPPFFPNYPIPPIFSTLLFPPLLLSLSPCPSPSLSPSPPVVGVRWVKYETMNDVYFDNFIRRYTDLKIKGCIQRNL